MGGILVFYFLGCFFFVLVSAVFFFERGRRGRREREAGCFLFHTECTEFYGAHWASHFWKFLIMLVSSKHSIEDVERRRGDGCVFLLFALVFCVFFFERGRRGRREREAGCFLFNTECTEFYGARWASHFGGV